MSFCPQFLALSKKNLITMKRNPFSTCCQFLFPIILFVCIALLRKALQLEDITFKGDDSQFIKSYSYISPMNKSTILSNSTLASAFNLTFPFMLCKQNNLIGVFGDNELTTLVKTDILKVIANMTFKDFTSKEELFSYLKDENYGLSLSELCFAYGIYKKDNGEYDYYLNFFAGQNNNPNIKSDIPDTNGKSLSPFDVNPREEDYNKYRSSGFLYMMNLISNTILKRISGEESGIYSGVIPMRFPVYSKDQFERVITFMIPFILIIIYQIPLYIYVYRMVKDKESRVKEGMKIMGMKDSAYFMSYFVNFLLVNLIIAIIGTIITKSSLGHINPGIRFIFLFLYGLSIYSLAYLIQGIADKSGIAIIMSILVYYIFYFISAAVQDEEISNTSKMFVSLLSPSALQLGFITMAKFEISNMDVSKNISYRFGNYSILDMLIMFIIDTFIYFFLGFYFENVLPHQFGQRKGVFFLCSKRFWSFGSKKKMVISNNSIENEKIKSGNPSPNANTYNINSSHHNSNNFQDESDYLRKNKEESIMKLSNVRKVFDDGKVALNGVNMNLYKGEIFALLGHNGAGKSTLINILSGLYEATDGEVKYEGENILENLDYFRKKIGICPQHDVLYDDLTVKEHLNLFANFKGLDTSNIESEIVNVLTELELYDKKDDLAKNLSGGQKRKLSIAIAIIGGSEIVFFDEPSSGMDITNRRKLWDILKKFTQGRIIILTTHYMEEASVLGKRIGILSSGQIKCIGSTLFLINRFGKHISLSIIKKNTKKMGLDEDEVNNKIVHFINKMYMKNYQSNDKTVIGINDNNQLIEKEILSEEILFRLIKGDEKGHKINYKGFFEELDQSLDELNIKSYSSSMPTLEDVFLLVSDEIRKGIIDKEDKEKNENIQNNNEYGEDKVDEGRLNINKENSKNHNKEGYSNYSNNQVNKPEGLSRIIMNIKWCLIKKYYQTIRNIKVFIMELLCPIILVLVGLGISKVEFIKDRSEKIMGLDVIDYSQTSLITKYPYLSVGNSVELTNSITSFSNKHKFEYFDNQNNNQSLIESLVSFSNEIKNKYNSTRIDNPVFNDTVRGGFLGSYYFIQHDSIKNIYEFIVFVDIKSQDSAPIMIQEMYNSLIKKASNNKNSIKVSYTRVILYIFYF